MNKQEELEKIIDDIAAYDQRYHEITRMQRPIHDQMDLIESEAILDISSAKDENSKPVFSNQSVRDAERKRRLLQNEEYQRLRAELYKINDELTSIRIEESRLHNHHDRLMIELRFSPPDDTFVLLFVDETSVSLHPVLRRCWMKRGQRKIIPAPGSPSYTHTFGAYNWRTGQVSYQTQDRKNSDSFIDFIEHIMLVDYPAVKVIMVMDNASYHRSKASMAALALFEQRLHVVWLPKYCPFLNAIERFWLQLKTLAAANCLHRDMDELIRAIDETICHQNQPDHPHRLNFAQHFRLTA